ncbi:AprI/Inh family metalloprotease inhibitor [Pseudomonas sp. PCH446]
MADGCVSGVFWRSHHGEQPAHDQPRGPCRPVADVPEGEKNQVCELDLALRSPRLSGDLECIAGWLGERPANWEPTPDGLWLYGGEGTGIVHFNRQKADRYEVRLKNGAVLVLMRDTP